MALLKIFEIQNPDDLINPIPIKDQCRGAQIDYENPQDVADLMAKHLSKILGIAFKKKIEQAIDDLKQRKKGEQLRLF